MKKKNGIFCIIAFAMFVAFANANAQEGVPRGAYASPMAVAISL